MKFNTPTSSTSAVCSVNTSLNPNKGGGVSVYTVKVEGRWGSGGNPQSRCMSPPGNVVRPVPLVSGLLLACAVAAREAEDERLRGREGG